METTCGWYFISGRFIMTLKYQHFEVEVIIDLRTCVTIWCHSGFIYVSQGIHYLWLNFTAICMLVWFENILNLNEYISVKAVRKKTEFIPRWNGKILCNTKVRTIAFINSLPSHKIIQNKNDPKMSLIMFYTIFSYHQQTKLD